MEDTNLTLGLPYHTKQQVGAGLVGAGLKNSLFVVHNRVWNHHFAVKILGF